MKELPSESAPQGHSDSQDVKDLNPIVQSTTRTSQKTLPPPDGGTRAWLICFAAHIMTANTWGIINSFGIFQAYYADGLGLPPSQISWIGSMQFILTTFLGVFSGRLADAGYFRLILAIGTSLVFLGLLGTSFGSEYWHFMLSQGVIVGFGTGLIACPIMSVTSTYFTSRKAMALGIMGLGNVTGGLVYPAMARQLIPSIGFAWALRTMAFVQLASSIPVNFIMRARLKTRIEGPFIDLSALKDVDFTLYATGMMLAQAGNYVGIYYMAQFSRTQITSPLSYPDSLNLLLIFAGVSFVGRILPVLLGDRLGPLNLMIPMIFCTGVVIIGWMGVTTSAGVYGWTTVFGVCSGAILSLHPPATLSLSRDLRKSGARIGLTLTINSASIMVGPPVAGAIIARMGGRYQGAQGYAGCLLMMGFALVSCAKLARKRINGEKWLDKV
ncbi:hypothetical protein MGG_09076 [Pyricularia oryzae 70-15]|uniref:Major facilitator superfamily (MFS) profile domain-containing protein n=3 Tax=Pyricularia oryzae TaxID=318829 RepID=G4MZS6_PYRO7|nr:uncharacterized protein MGG_09076 [Pyricularia oryzae 70-15]EHA51370.1 hypothetical protein MGG_09076 [Pyricularia oryzae 70-15]ELQ35005.1 hypothetical protein OOU_Y34scaffold00734g16 [Pyricularia oryzae Y34]KAI7910927.1 hypothetical protein M9X92_010807 [Pyricularia oryzae]KAI7911864.1 hypothetical protein M0657_010720 [Pyricularia oryzae]